MGPDTHFRCSARPAIRRPWVRALMDKGGRPRKASQMRTPLETRAAGATVGLPPKGPAQLLFWRLFIINGLLFAIGTLVLALSPATVSSPVLLTEVPVLIIGLALILAANAALVRSSLAPLDALTTVMRRVVDLPASTPQEEIRGAMAELARHEALFDDLHCCFFGILKHPSLFSGTAFG